jgi:hypothetical protein
MSTVIKFSLLLLLSFRHFSAVAQTEDLAVVLNKQYLNLKDTVTISARYTIDQVPPPAATLFLKIVNDNGLTWELRWPLLNGVMMSAIILPADITPGHYRFYFSAQKSFFIITGKVKKPAGIRMLKTMLLTTDGASAQNNIPVDENGRFEYKNQLFTKEASLFFSRVDKGDNEDLDVSINTVLDSAYVSSPETLVIHTLIGMPDSVELKEPNGPADPASPEINTTKTLQIVTVFAQRIKPAENFEKIYATGAFKNGNGRVIDLLSNPAEAAGQSVFYYLQSRIAGITFSTGGDAPVATWRGEIVEFYLDEIQVQLADLRSIMTRNVAIIKVFPPPFFNTRLGGSGGAVAVYTKRGEFVEKGANKTAFRVKGYSPTIVFLPTEPE